ncbi:T9SS type A sorting domain-containing protein [Algibacter sp. 2305UL17-15]|uniref:T9SS type A sorting domain-containing protein n=1 Tax=Algibacter sp. 2305UL17-15 TaxID=3231268 RepID=UPI00345A117F
MKQILIILCFFSSFCSHAQFLGGTNDGDSYASIFGTQLNGSIVSYTIMYRAGNGDGYDLNYKNGMLTDNTLSFYNGGMGDGFAKYVTTDLLTGESLSTIFSGSSGDGFSNQISNTTVLKGTNLTALYNGNTGDGFAMNFLTDVLLQGFMTELYKGGTGDGFASLISSENFLNGLMAELFNGGNGDGYASEIVSSSLTLDLIEELIKLDVLLYPNPASHIVNIKPKDGVSITSVELYDVSGKKVLIKLSNENTLNVSNLSDGIYLLNIFSENGSVSKKLIVKK